MSGLMFRLFGAAIICLHVSVVLEAAGEWWKGIVRAEATERKPVVYAVAALAHTIMAAWVYVALARAAA
ncbi:MAG: hypothetical protein AB7E55_01355 [Pigmentiphaga sp.]